MKNTPRNSFSSVTIKQKLTMAFAISIFMMITVTFFVYVVIKMVQEDQKQLYETIVKAEEMPMKAELLSILDQSGEKIKFFQIIIIAETVSSIILMILMGVIITRSIQRSNEQS